MYSLWDRIVGNVNHNHIKIENNGVFYLLIIYLSISDTEYVYFNVEHTDYFYGYAEVRPLPSQ